MVPVTVHVQLSLIVDLYPRWLPKYETLVSHSLTATCTVPTGKPRTSELPHQPSLATDQSWFGEVIHNVQQAKNNMQQ